LNTLFHDPHPVRTRLKSPKNNIQTKPTLTNTFLYHNTTSILTPPETFRSRKPPNYFHHPISLSKPRNLNIMLNSDLEILFAVFGVILLISVCNALIQGRLDEGVWLWQPLPCQSPSEENPPSYNESQQNANPQGGPVVINNIIHLNVWEAPR
jgi:hypothetical protein